MREASRAIDFPAPAVETPSDEGTPGDSTAATHSTCRRKRCVFVPRVFVEPIPSEVAKRIEEDIYFLRAWRLYRELSPVEAGELAGLSRDTILWHEHGYNVPNIDTLKRFADIYDCTVEQLSAQPGSRTASDDQPHHAARTRPVESAPDDTQYPDAVMAHLLAGKSPVTAWRMHRRKTIEQCAKAYGSTAANIRAMEALPVLRERTRKRLALIFTCKPVQLLRPESIASGDATASGAVLSAPGGRRSDAGNDDARHACF